jgi:hypothetical protein
MQCFAPELRPVGTLEVPPGLANVRPLAIVHEAKVQEQQPGLTTTGAWSG